jgi:hypothetical protein
MTLTFVRDKGSPLVATELDGNTDEIAAVKTRVTALEDGENPIADISISGDQMTITLSNSDEFTFTIPVRDINDVGTWTPSTAYAVDDYFDDNNGGFFRVIFAHTSGLTFDEDANDGMGHDYYRRLIHSPGNSFPAGGVLGDVMLKLSATDYDKGWGQLNSIYVTFTPPTGSALESETVFDTLLELEDLIAALSADLSGLTIDFDDLTGTIGADQRDATVTALGTTGTISLDPTLGDVFTITPTGDVTLNAASAPANAKITLIVTTSGTTSRNITPNTNFKSTGALATGIVSGKTFSISFVGDGTNLVEVSRTTAM